MDNRQETKDLANMLVGIVLYFVSFIFYLTYPDINLIDRITYFIALGSLGWLLYEAIESDYDMLVRTIFIAPLFFFIIFLHFGTLNLPFEGSIIDPNQKTVYIAVALLSLPFAELLRRTRKKKAAMNQSQQQEPGYSTGADYDPYGSSNTGYNPFGNSYGSRNNDYYEPRSQYKRDTDYQYYSSQDGSSSDPVNENYANPGYFSKVELTPELLRAIFTALGFMLKNCSSNQELQDIYVEEMAERLGIRLAVVEENRKCIEEGKNTSFWNIKLCIQESKILLQNRELACAVLYTIAGGLFYDEIVTPDESAVYAKLAEAFQIGKEMAGRIFLRLVKDFNLYLDPESGNYKAHGFSNGRSYNYEEDDSYEEKKSTPREEFSDKEIKNAYKTLQVKPDSSNKEIKSSYRRLIARYHPDKAISKGLSEKEIEKYNEITQKLNIAWDIIRTERNL